MEVIDRPLPFGFEGNQPGLVVIHAMGEWIEYKDRIVSAWELLRLLKLSAHVLVHPSGNQIVCRKENQVAYHARGFNKHSLGVEFLVPGVHTYTSFLDAMVTDYTRPSQLESGIELVRGWKHRYQLPDHRILKHSTLAPRKKHDPGIGFPWDKFMEGVCK